MFQQTGHLSQAIRPIPELDLLFSEAVRADADALAEARLKPSHLLDHGKNAHAILQENADSTSSPEKFLKPQPVRGIDVEIVEMSGRACDVYLIDLRVLHSPSVNTSKNVRMIEVDPIVRTSF